MQKTKKAWTIKQFIIFFMIFIMLFQALVFALILTIGGSIRNIADNSYRPLMDTSGVRLTVLETQLNSAADVLISSSPSIKRNLQNVADKYRRPLSALADNQNAKMEMYMANMDALRALTSKENISGAFLIMDTRLENNTQVSAVFLRKTDTATENVNAPTTLLIGGDYLTQNGVTHKSIYWSQCLNMPYSDDYDFYYRPMQIANENENIPAENLGYWSFTYDINDAKRSVISYSLPIRDSENKVVGVMGIEIDLNYIQLLLPYLELNSQRMGNYVITSVDSVDAVTGKRVLVSGETFNTINNYSPDIEFSSKSDLEGMFTLVPKGKNISKVYCTKNELDINKNAAYSYSPWMLSSVVESKYLLAFVDKLKRDIILAFALTMIISLLFIINFVDKMIAPINYFVSTIKKIRPDNLITPEPTRLAEINELGTSIADLTAEISNFSKKASAIISMTGISIAAFEYDPASNLVFGTEDMFKVLGMYKKEKNALYIEKSIFDNRIVPIVKGSIRADLDMISEMKYGKELKWLHIKTVKSDEKIIGTIRDVTAEVLEKQRHDYERDHDPLTGFLNRQPFVERIVKRFEEEPPMLALMAVCKIPDLTALNTRSGSLVGDKYIKKLSEILITLDRKTSIMSRTMGDEFTIIIDGISVEEITNKFNELLEKLNNTVFIDGEITLPLNIFAGVAWYPNDAKNVNDLITYAEFAAKSNSGFTGRNLVQVFSAEAYELSVHKRKVQDRIGEMLEEGTMGYAYQPIIDTSTGDIYGYEALMRPDPEAGVTPGDVMGYAADHNAYYAVERATWLNALKGFTEQVDCLSPKKIFINSIPNQLLKDEDVALIEEKYGEYMDNVVLEILENEQTDEDFVEKKRALKEKWKCLLALDDFGSGYANENSLLTIKPDLIKLDLDLVANIDKDADRQSLVKNIVSYAHNRSIKVLAEGIETREQMNILLSLDVDLLQGFYLAKPNERAIEAIDDKIKEEITTFDPNDMFNANVALRM